MSAIDFINQKYDIKEDHSPRIVHPFELDLDVNVTAIIGGSGTGKTTLLREWFNTEDVTFEVDSDMSIFEQLCKEGNDEEYERVSKLLFDVGLSSVPMWKNTYNQISNGEKLRFEIAYKLNGEESVIFIDEFTSMLDRQTSYNLCRKLNGLLDKYDKKLVISTCHFDILEQMDIDRVVDTNLKKSSPINPVEKITLTTWRSKMYQEIGGTYLATITI